MLKCTFELMFYIISRSLNEKILINNFVMCVKTNKIDPTVNNKRICKTPFFKWYIKGYTHKSDNVKNVNYILGFTNKIHENLKTKSNNITIIKINFIT